MAGRVPKRTTQPPGSGQISQKKGPIVGYGLGGKPFRNKAKFNASKAGQALHGGQMGSGHNPMPGHPSQNPTHYHGPSTTGTIKGAKPRI